MATGAHGQPGLEQIVALRLRVADYHKSLTQTQKAVGGLDTLPWHLLPSIDHLQPDQSLPKVRANGRHRPDGKFITQTTLAETKIVLAAFVKCCHNCTSLSAASRKDISRRLPEMSAICLVLNLIGARKFLGGFIAKFILDASLPLQSEVVVSIFPDRKKALEFLGKQYRANPRVMVPQTHYHLEDMEPTPYPTVRELGEGGSGYVDEIKDVMSNRIFARKLLRCAPKAAGEAESRLEEEAQVLKRLLNHNHVIQLVNTYRRENLFGLVMSPVAKASLHDIMELPSGDRAWARSVLRRSPGCLTSALADIHSLKIRHKDITPKNILICDDDVILTDFGISVDVSEMTSTDSTRPTAKTRQYCSPEVANNENQGRSSDVFSLGCVVLIVLALLRENDPHGLAEVLSFRPFPQSVDEAQSWIQHQTELEQESLRTMWLRTCRYFIQEAPQSRPTARDALEKNFSGSASEELLKDSFCGQCLKHNDNPEYAEERQKSRLSAQAARNQVHNAQNVQPEDDMAADSTNTESLTYSTPPGRQPPFHFQLTSPITFSHDNVPRWPDTYNPWDSYAYHVSLFEKPYDPASDLREGKRCELDNLRGAHLPPALEEVCTAWEKMQQEKLHYDQERKSLGDLPLVIKHRAVANLVHKALARRANLLFDGVFLTEGGVQNLAEIERIRKSPIDQLMTDILRFKEIIDVEELDEKMLYRIEYRLEKFLNQLDTEHRSEFLSNLPETETSKRASSVDPMMNETKDFSPRYNF